MKDEDAKEEREMQRKVRHADWQEVVKAEGWGSRKIRREKIRQKGGVYVLE